MSTVEEHEREQEALTGGFKMKRLTSSTWVHTPGVVKWARCMEGDWLDKEEAIRWVRAAFLCESYPGLDWDSAIAIIEGNYTVVDDTVEIGERTPR